MRGSTRALVLTAALAACAMTSAHADDNSTLEERMSFKDFTRLGLDKLSPEQLKGLNEWMKTHGGPMCPTGIMAPAAGAAPMAAGAAPAAEKNKYSARLVGEFKGWEKGTILRLADGTAWEVRDDDPFIAHSATPPTITVEKSLIAGWRLSVSGYNEVARVIPAK